MTIYLPDDLAAEVKDKLGDANISGLCQAALRNELARLDARARFGSEDFERVEIYDGDTGRDVAFRGRLIGQGDPHDDQRAYLSAGGSILVHDESRHRYWIVDDFSELAEGDWDAALLRDAADALGERYVEELDI